MATLFYSELNNEQIFFEIIKRFTSIEYHQDQLSMYDIFGDEWRLLNKKSRSDAEEWFQSVIYKKLLKGIIYEENDSGKITYKRITNDIFKK